MQRRRGNNRKGSGLAPGEGVADHINRRFNPGLETSVPAWSREPPIAVPDPNAYDPRAAALAAQQRAARPEHVPPHGAALAATPQSVAANTEVERRRLAYERALVEASQGQQQKRRAQEDERSRAKSKMIRTVCLFGPPQSGVTALSEILGKASSSVAILVPDFGDLQDQVRQVSDDNPGKMIIIVGVPLSAEALQGVWDMRYAAPPHGMLVEVQAPYEVCAKRGAPEAAYRVYEEEHARLVERAQELSARLYGVQNDGSLEQAVIRLAELLGLED